uniref:Kinase n=1 Tax=Anoplophora glabripennis TaxID=217634 RepID=V5GJI6_ANOGL
MGKSEIQSMPIHRPESNLICVPSTCKDLYITNLTNGIEEEAEENETDEVVPNEVEMLPSQVAGHMNDGKSAGMMRQNGLILKPIVKKEYGEREIWLYRKLDDTVDRSLIEFREFVPKFYGTKTVNFIGKDYECIVLEDLTKYYREPCIMDIKIGRRTWDPKATYEKIIAEETKYLECKRDLGFCIPGFQVYKLHNNQLVKFGKDFGKSLNKERAEDAIKAFLNAEGGIYCRSLIVQFLAAFWRIQHWVRNQRRLRLYSSSILLVYDARRLREHVKHIKVKSPLKLTRNKSLYRPISLAVLNNEAERIQTGFSGQLTKEGPILRSPTSPNKLVNLEVPCVVNNNNTWQKSIHTLRRTHSFQNNYDKDVQHKKQNYAYMLEQLCSEQKSECWATAKMIDFAHVFPAENCDIDRNYLEGIESLVKLFEEFLVESE